MSTETKVQEYIMARISAEHAAAVADAKKRVLAVKEKALREELIGDGEGKMSYKMDNGTTFAVKDSFRCTVPEHQYEVVEQFLASMEENPDDYFKRTIKAGAITSFMKKIYEEQGAFALPQLEKKDGSESSWFDTTPSLSVLNWKKNYGETE